MRNTFTFGLALVLALGGAMAVSAPVEARPAFATALMTMAGDPEPPVACGECKQNFCTNGWHRLVTTPGPDRTYDEQNHTCEEEYCSIAHPSSPLCGGDSFAMSNEALQAMQLAEGGKTLSTLIADSKGMIVYNAERRTLQVKGCDSSGTNTVIANIPLTDAQVVGLE